ncbi:hypothetical protein MCOR02_007172 [Pyricularia oryzae]|uniref:Solute carrier family 25 member 33 n=1 Tax=Pyricularia oryzae TaxID=318829 RepID=A0A4P7NQU2_PYROR|nr:hypothetical protein MCOR02_007172 [Pyricularia oryzae]KAI6289900.1 hypothetical protein MCOR34_010589 [Pyricularia oryzae]KAI6453844.1 hypothetical protein MCOR17_009183 [Pyricularia oryzae]KAI6552123.1 hypothetical protein MCOR04_010963 [Pyricularia oryzae]QBZ64765.1 hypothetical protein PoMZ_06466 [Pyricularia oryzae]
MVAANSAGRDGLSPAMVETVAGLSAGTAATLAVHPLDIVKTRMQIHRSNAAAAASASSKPGLAQQPPPLRAVAVLRSLVQTEKPIAALYRGLTPNLVGNATSWASFFFFKKRCEQAILSLKKPQPAADGSLVVNDGDKCDDGSARLTPQDYFVSSAAAGAAVQVLTNPVWVLKTRMLSSDRGSVGAYPSMWAGATRVWREEGPRGFYRGLGISLLGVSHGAVQFAVYEPAKRLYVVWRSRGRQHDAASAAKPAAGGSVMTNEATLVISTAAKLFANAVTYPYQVLRSRLQNYDAENQFGRGIVGAATRLWREEGVRGFYRGLVPGVVRVLPATWVTFLVYENTKYYLPRWTAGSQA